METTPLKVLRKVENVKEEKSIPPKFYTFSLKLLGRVGIDPFLTKSNHKVLRSTLKNFISSLYDLLEEREADRKDPPSKGGTQLEKIRRVTLNVLSKDRIFFLKSELSH